MVTKYDILMSIIVMLIPPIIAFIGIATQESHDYAVAILIAVFLYIMEGILVAGIATGLHAQNCGYTMEVSTVVVYILIFILVVILCFFDH